MSLRIIMIGLMMVTAVALGLVAYQIANPTRLATATIGSAALVAAPAVEARPTTVSYLVASHPVPPGTLARADDFSLKTVEPDKVPPGAVIDSGDTRNALRGSLVRRYLDTGAVLSADDLMRPRERGFLAAVLAPGTRAVSIGVDPVTGVAGLIWPGDHVDVILTQELDTNDGHPGHTITSQTVLSNVRVIAVDQDIAQGAPASGSATGKLASTVTIQATTEQAERLAVGLHLGHLSLAVRAIADDDGTADRAITVSGTDVSPVRSPSGISLGARMQVIQGDQRSEVNFR